MRKKLYIALSLCALLFSACNKRIDFGEPEMTVRIAPNWRQMAKPEKLKVAFYKADCTLYNAYDLAPEGGEVTLPKGEYKVILYNDDAESILFNSMDLHTTATGQIISTRASSQNLNQPGLFYTSTGEVSPESLLLTPQMSSRSIRIIIKIEIAGDLAVENISTGLRNIADAINLYSGTVYHSLGDTENRTQLTDKGVQSGFRTFDGLTFGRCQQEACDALDMHNIYADITLNLADGTQRSLTADITEPIKDVIESETEVSVEIRIESIVGGLTATVTGWKAGTASGDITQ